MNLQPFFVSLIPILYLVWLAWIESNPQAALRLVARWKRRFRQYLIHKHGKDDAEIAFRMLRKEAAKKGVSPKATEQFIQEVKKETIQRLGTKYADDLMGPPNLIEENF